MCMTWVGLGVGVVALVFSVFEVLTGGGLVE